MRQHHRDKFGRGKIGLKSFRNGRNWVPKTGERKTNLQRRKQLPKRRHRGISKDGQPTLRGFCSGVRYGFILFLPISIFGPERNKGPERVLEKGSLLRHYPSLPHCPGSSQSGGEVEGVGPSDPVSKAKNKWDLCNQRTNYESKKKDWNTKGFSIWSDCLDFKSHRPSKKIAVLQSSVKATQSS